MNQKCDEDKEKKRVKIVQGNQSAQPPQENSLCVSNVDIIRSLQHSERDIFYSTILEDHCLPAMHPIFEVLFRRFDDHSVLANATLALSSCSFSRLYPEKKASVTSEMGSLSPHLVHQTRSQLYYSLAIKRFTAFREHEIHDSPTMVLTVLIIFAYIESSMGNFQGFYCHDQGIISLLSHLKISSRTDLDSLLAAWLQIRIVVWWARAYFCSLEVHRHLPSTLPPGITMENLPAFQGQRVNVLSIMCESHRINFSALLRHWDTGDFGAQGSELCSGDEEFDKTCHFLAQQGEMLDRWLDALPTSDLPIDGLDGVHEIDHVDQRTPIFFRSHEAALNFAYYTVARIMQSTGLLRSLKKADPSYIPYDSHTEESWTRVLLRIARGTKMETSLSRNSYTIGFSGLLLTALLRCQARGLALEIQEWLQDLEILKPTEEGAFPLYQTLGVVNTINCQKMANRDVFAVTQSVDDEGGTPKINAYNSQSISSLLFHGMSQTSGALFTDYLPVAL
jgi:hypothetical protein